MKIKTNPLAVKDIEEIALRVRQEFNISEDTFFPIIDILEQLNNEGKLNLEVCEDSFLVDEYANYNPLTNTITVKESVYNESYSDIYRSNFTLAHEFFHYIQTKVLKFIFIEVDECKNYMDIEWQANEFAAQLLIPTKALTLEVADIVSIYHVSEEAAYYRKYKLKKRSK